jgi:hypothetical protein
MSEGHNTSMASAYGSRKGKAVSFHFTRRGAERAAKDRQSFYDSFGGWLETKAWVERSVFRWRRWAVKRTD